MGVDVKLAKENFPTYTFEATIDGKDVGFLHITFNDGITSGLGPCFYVSSVNVDLESRRKRVGTKLYEAALRFAAAEGFPICSGHEQTPEAKGFWEKQKTKGRATWTATDRWGGSGGRYQTMMPPPPSLDGFRMANTGLPSFEIQASGSVYYGQEPIGELEVGILDKLDPDAQRLARLWADVSNDLDPENPFRVYAWRPEGKPGRVYLELEFTLGSPFHAEIGIVDAPFDEFTRSTIIEKADRLAAMFQEMGYDARRAFLREGSDIRKKIESVVAVEITVNSIDQSIAVERTVRQYLMRQDLMPFIY